MKVIFVPAYLNGSDGIFNVEYYDFLIGFDGSVFPSYYEPWGYTPLESLAFHIPTITTTLAGFGLWISSINDNPKTCITVIDRTDDNDKEVVEAIANSIFSCTTKQENDIKEARKISFDISRSALWSNLVSFYWEAYSIALKKVNNRSELFIGKHLISQETTYKKIKETKPEWKKILVKQNISNVLSSLDRLSKNLWWTWNYEASELFEMINPELWTNLNRNPIALIEKLSIDEMQKLEKNDIFLNKLTKVTALFDAYMSKDLEKSDKQIAYFSMEFGLHDIIRFSQVV